MRGGDLRALNNRSLALQVRNKFELNLTVMKKVILTYYFNPKFYTCGECMFTYLEGISDVHLKGRILQEKCVGTSSRSYNDP